MVMANIYICVFLYMGDVLYMTLAPPGEYD